MLSTEGLPKATLTHILDTAANFVSVSDRASTGVYEDKGLPALKDWLGRALQNPLQFEARLTRFQNLVQDDHLPEQFE